MTMSEPESGELPSPWPIDLDELRANVRTLVELEETSDLVVSCYLDVTTRGFAFAEAKADEIRKTLEPEERAAFEQALERMRGYVESGLAADTRGVAAFARGGVRPFFMTMQFHVPVVDRLSVDLAPSIYGLIELKDTYQRFVVLIVTDEYARILEVSLGAVTADVWGARPERLKDVPAGLVHEQYQNHKRDRTERFIREKVAILDRLMKRRGHSRLVIAGAPHLIERTRAALPPRLASQLVDVVELASTTSTSDVVTSTVARIVAAEQAQSLSAAELFVQEIRRGSLAVAGTRASLDALELGQVDTFLMTTSYAPPPAWKCRSCGAVALQEPPRMCRRCFDVDLAPVSLKEEMLRLADRHEAKVELMHGSSILHALGGVGCLLRYQQTWRPEPQGGDS